MSNTSNSETSKLTIHTLCGVQGCCPTVKINHELGNVVISDDFGGSVTLTKAEWLEAIQKVNFN